MLHWKLNFKAGIFLLSFLTSICGWSQLMLNDPSLLEEFPEKSIIYSGFGYYGSTALDNETTSLFNNGGFYSPSLKLETQKRLRNYNYLGAEYSNKLEYTDSGSELIAGMGHYVNIESAGSQGLIFSKDLFNIIFEGNGNYVGDTAWLSRTEYSGYGYQKIGFGIANKGKFKAGLGILNFTNYRSGILDKSYLYTSPAADSIFLEAEGRFKNGTGSSTGIGIGIDFEIVSNLLSTDSIVSSSRGFVLGARNLGVYIGNSNTQHYRMDTSYSFTGFEVNSLTDIQAELFASEKLTDTLLPNAESKRHFELLPAEVYFYSPADPIGKKLQVIYGFRYRIKSATQAMVTFGINYRASEQLQLNTYLIGGGFNYVQWGVSLDKKFNQVNLGLGFNNMIGLLSKEGYGKSASLTLKYTFKDEE